MTYTYFFYKQTDCAIAPTAMFVNKQIICVKQGFELKALIFGIAWPLYKRAWKTFLACCLLLLFIFIIVEITSISYSFLRIINIALSFFLATSMNDIFHFELQHKYQLMSAIDAKNEQEAKLKFIKSCNNEI